MIHGRSLLSLVPVSWAGRSIPFNRAILFIFLFFFSRYETYFLLMLFFLRPFPFLLFPLSLEYPALVMWIDTKSEDEVSWVHATNCFG